MVHSIDFGPIWLTMVQSGPFCILWSSTVRSVYIGFIMFYSVHLFLFSLPRSIMFTYLLFSPLWSFSVNLVQFCPLQSNSFYFGPIRPTLVILGLLWSQSVHSVHFGSFRSISVLLNPLWSYSIHMFLFSLLWSYSLYFSSYGFICSTLVLFGPIQSILVTLVHFVCFCALKEWEKIDLSCAHLF